MEKVKLLLSLVVLLLPVSIEYIKHSQLSDFLPLWSGEIIITVFMICFFWKIRHLKITIKEMERVDKQTGFLNLKVFHQDLVREIARAQRYKIDMSAVYLVINNYSQMKKKFGKAESDLLLTRLTYQFEQTLRMDIDGCYRLEENIFAMILPNTNEKQAHRAMERITIACKKTPCHMDKYGITFSVGITQIQEEETCEHFVKRLTGGVIA